MSSQRRLGRGLEALLGRSLEEGAPTGVEAPPTTGVVGSPVGGEEIGALSRDEDGQRWLDLGVIEPNPHQPRKHFDEEEIADLADSIREHGVLQPLVVRRIDGRFELVAGERRLRALQSLDWKSAPVTVRDLEDRQTAELALVENLQRKDLNPLEKAASFEKYLRDYDCTQEELAGRVHINRSTVANLIRLLELPEAVKQMLVAGELSQGHARALLGLPSDQQTQQAKKVVADGLSVRRTEQLVQELLSEESEAGLRLFDGEQATGAPAPTRSEQLAALEAELATALGAKVKLTQNAKGAGKITLSFKDGDEFERLRARLTASPQPVAEAA